PDRRGIIADMTCDSDGMVETYVENESLDSSLPLVSAVSRKANSAVGWSRRVVSSRRASRRISRARG
ncbi:hypothetical protein C7E24_19705, partial [Stenotrophomonas maltophilia]